MHYLRRLNCISYDYYIELHLVKTNVMRINNIVEKINCFLFYSSFFVLNLSRENSIVLILISQILEVNIVELLC